MNLDLEFLEANSRITDYINNKWDKYNAEKSAEREIERYMELGIFPMYTSGCLTKELNDLHHITQILPKYPTLYEKFLETGKIERYE